MKYVVVRANHDITEKKLRTTAEKHGYTLIDTSHKIMTNFDTTVDKLLTTPPNKPTIIMLKRRVGMGYTYKSYAHVSAAIELGANFSDSIENGGTYAQRLGRFCGYRHHNVQIYTNLRQFEDELLPFYTELDQGKISHIVPKTPNITGCAKKSEIHHKKLKIRDKTEKFKLPLETTTQLINQCKIGANGQIVNYGDHSADINLIRSSLPSLPDAKFRREVGVIAPSFTLISNNPEFYKADGTKIKTSKSQREQYLRLLSGNSGVFWSQGGKTLDCPEGRYMYLYINVDDGTVIADTVKVTNFENTAQFIGQLQINKVIYYTDSHKVEAVITASAYQTDTGVVLIPKNRTIIVKSQSKT